jgi:hypothetical protein
MGSGQQAVGDGGGGSCLHFTEYGVKAAMPPSLSLFLVLLLLLYR